MLDQLDDVAVGDDEFFLKVECEATDHSRLEKEVLKDHFDMSCHVKVSREIAQTRKGLTASKLMLESRK